MTELKERFLAFHAANPHVYELFCQYTQELIGRGHRRGSADAVVHQIRWHIKLNGGQKIKVANAHAAYYARMWLKEHPQYPNFFQLCTVKGEAA